MRGDWFWRWERAKDYAVLVLKALLAIALALVLFFWIVMILLLIGIVATQASWVVLAAAGAIVFSCLAIVIVIGGNRDE